MPRIRNLVLPAVFLFPATGFGLGTGEPAVDAFNGCYDLSNMQSLLSGAGDCKMSGETVVPASITTRAMVSGFLHGATVNITTDQAGNRTVGLEGFDSVETRLFLHDSGGPAADPERTKRLSRPGPRRRKVARAPPLQPDLPSLLLPLRKENPNPSSIPQTMDDRVPPDSEIELSPPSLSLRDETPRGSGGLKELVNDIARSASRMSCQEGGCTCPHPPCIPCDLINMQQAGYGPEEWASWWITWYSGTGSTSERILAVRSLGVEEERVLRAAKYRWGFTRAVDAAVSVFDWARGRLPGSRSPFGLRSLAANGARVIRTDVPATDREVRGALSIAADPLNPKSARLHAMKWIEERAVLEGDVRTVFRRIGMGDPDDSVRGMALDVLDRADGSVANR